MSLFKNVGIGGTAATVTAAAMFLASGDDSFSALEFCRNAHVIEIGISPEAVGTQYVAHYNGEQLDWKDGSPLGMHYVGDAAPTPVEVDAEAAACLRASQ